LVPDDPVSVQDNPIIGPRPGTRVPNRNALRRNNRNIIGEHVIIISMHNDFFII